MYQNTVQNNTFTNYTKSDKLTQKLLLLPVHWNENDSLLTKLLQVLSKLLVIHMQRTLSTVLRFIVSIKYASQRVLYENGTKFFGWIGLY